MIEQKLLVTSKYTVASSKLPKKFDNTDFIVLADLHNRNFGKNNVRLMKQIDKLSPQFILVAGDMINKKETACPSNAFTLLESLAKRYKLYYAYGNHEQRAEQYQSETSGELIKLYDTWEEYKQRLSGLGVTFLNNDSIMVGTKSGEKIRISGVSIGPKYFEWNKLTQLEEGYQAEIIGDSSKELYQILIAHNPIFFMDYAKWGADLTVSGHLHGGMVRIPGIGGVLSPQAKFFPKYHSGNYTELGQEMIVSRGLGSHSIMPRLFNIPELVYVKLKSEASEPSQRNESEKKVISSHTC
jgi:predicted MPP superfamily phosphohydrolase